MPKSFSLPFMTKQESVDKNHHKLKEILEKLPLFAKSSSENSHASKKHLLESSSPSSGSEKAKDLPMEPSSPKI